MPLVSRQIHSRISAIQKRRFLARLKPEGECLVFTGTKNERGYGLVDLMIDRRRVATLAHRLAWMIANNRDVADGMIICHRCNNTSCCNHNHLYEGTHKTNADDMVRSGRQRKVKPWLGVKGEAHPMTRYPDAVKAMAILLRERGYSNKKVARLLNVPRQAVSLWWCRHVKARTQTILDS